MTGVQTCALPISHLDDVLDAQARVLEQVGGLSIDLKGGPIVEKVEIE